VNVPGTLRLFWTDEELPTKEADWGSDAVQVYPTGVSVYSQLFAWQGKPVVVALASGQTSHSEGELHFAGSNTPDFLDYITTRITPAGFYMPNYGGLVYRNRIAALFGDPAAPNLFLARQVAVDPTLPDKWDLTPIAPPGSSAAHPATMVLLGDKLVVAFCDATDGRLTLAITDSDY
jgi:hypothetical protein